MHIISRPQLIVPIIVLAGAAIESIAESLSYKAMLHNSKWFLIAAWVLYLFVVILLIQAYKYKGVGYINALWSGITTLLLLTIGYTVFGERLSKNEWIGAILVLAGVFLLNSKSLYI